MSEFIKNVIILLSLVFTMLKSVRYLEQRTNSPIAFEQFGQLTNAVDQFFLRDLKPISNIVDAKHWEWTVLRQKLDWLFF